MEQPATNSSKPLFVYRAVDGIPGFSFTLKPAWTEAKAADLEPDKISERSVGEGEGIVDCWCMSGNDAPMHAEEYDLEYTWGENKIKGTVTVRKSDSGSELHQLFILTRHGEAVVGEYRREGPLDQGETFIEDDPDNPIGKGNLLAGILLIHDHVRRERPKKRFWFRRPVAPSWLSR